MQKVIILCDREERSHLIASCLNALFPDLDIIIATNEDEPQEQHAGRRASKSMLGLKKTMN